MVEGMGAVTAVAMAVATAAVITAVDIVAAVVVTISVAGIMAGAIFTAGRRISALSPGIVHSPHVVRSLPNA